MSDKVSTIALRAIACDIEDCEQPQSWADAMRAAVSEIEKLRAALKTARRDAREEAASLVDDVRQWDGRDEYCESCKGGAVYPDARDVAATIRALGEKE